MSISFMADNGVAIPCARDAAVYDLIGGGVNYVVKGIGTEMALNYNSTSRTVSVGSGVGVIRGRHVSITGTESITLPANSNGYIVIEYDLSQSGANVCTLKSVSSAVNGNINDSDIVSDLVIGSYTTNASGVASFNDERIILGGSYYSETSGVSRSTQAIRYGTTEPVSSLGNDGDIYLMYE